MQTQRGADSVSRNFDENGRSGVIGSEVERGVREARG